MSDHSNSEAKPSRWYREQRPSQLRDPVVCHDELKKLVINSMMTFSKEVEVLWSPVLRGDLVINYQSANVFLNKDGRV